MATDAVPTTLAVTVTSNQSQSPATAMSAKNTPEFLIRFPPFPEVPDGVEIISFKDYKEKGIRVQPGGEDNQTEVDACGVPTAALSSIHSTDWCKTETKRAKFNTNNGGRKRKKRKTGGGISGGPTLLDWPDYWEEREAAYRIQNSYDPHAPAYELFCQGASDFKNFRPWPLAQKQSGPVFVWGEFLRFAGIPFNFDGAKVEEPVEPTPRQSTGDDSDSDIDMDDDEDDMRGILKPQDLASMSSAMKAQARGEEFIRDPALMLKVFFSSYARDRGIIWTDANLTCAPLLMRFFIDFLINNRVLPKREENAFKHDSTRRVIDLALKELPLTSRLAKVWPDDFHKACKACWGSKAEVFVFGDIEGLMEDGGGEGGANDNTNAPEGATTTPAAEPGWSTSNWTAADTFADSGQSNGWSNNNGWSSTMVTVNMDEEGNVDVEEEASAPNVGNDPEPEPQPANDGWGTYTPPSLLPLLGPTALPLTHTTGIVESSTRRIKAVIPPSTDTAKFPIAKDVSPDAVEGVLKRTFGIVVFEPWVNWNKGEESHLSMPRILDTSRGTVKTDSAGGITGESGEAAPSTDTPPPAPSALPPFDPHKGGISVLIDPAYIDLFSVGMGCLGTWVQLARVKDFEPQDPKKKKKKNATMERLWYAEELLRVIPSYYTYLG